MGCIIELQNIKIDEVVGKSFTEKDFDNWLWQNKELIKEQLKYAPKEFDPMFALDLTQVEKRRQTFEDFKKKMSEFTQKISDTRNRQKMAKDLGTSEEISDGLIVAAVTDVYTRIGNADSGKIMEPVHNWEKSTAQHRQKIYNESSSEEKAKSKLKEEDITNAYRKLDGSIFGAMVQDYLTKRTNNGDLAALQLKPDIKQTLKFLGITWEQAVNRVRNAVIYTDENNKQVNILENIAKRMSKFGSEYHTEFKIHSDKLAPEFKAALEKAYEIAHKPKPSGITGSIDIISLDSTNVPNMFDIKLSSAPIDTWWGAIGGNWEGKYDEVSAQQMTYFTIAQQYGLYFAGAYIIPAHAVYNGNELVKIEDEDFKEFTPTNKYAVAAQKYFPVTIKSDPTMVDNLTKDINELFPELELNAAVKQREFTLDWYRKYYRNKVNDKYTIPIDSRFPSEDVGMPSNISSVSFQTWEQAEEFLTKTYLPKMNEILAENNKQLAKGLEKLAKSPYDTATKIDKLLEMTQDISKNSRVKAFIKNVFKKYVCDGWTLISDSENLLVNYGIYAFQKGGVVEFVVLDDQDLFAQYRLGDGHNTNILGNYVNDMQQGVDDISILKAYRGNLLAMKVMALIARNENGWFDGKKLQAVRVVNMLYKQELTQFNDKLVDNWNKLTYYYNQAHPDGYRFRTLGKDTVLSGVLALVNRADDLTRLFLRRNVHFIEHHKHVEAMSDDTSEEILKYIRNLVSEYRVDSAEDWRKYSEEFEAYQLLTQALLATRGFLLSMENDCGDFFQGIFLSGTKILSPQESSSANVRILSQIEAVYDRKLRDEYQKIVYPWQIALVEALEESGFNNSVSNERDLFKLCFERDENGKITPDFCLIPPDENDDLRGKPKLKKLVNLFLETINTYRIPDESTREGLKSQRGSIYYQVPLTKATWKQQKKQSGRWNAAKTKVDEFLDSTKDFMFGDTMSNWELKQYDDISTERIFNPYFDISDYAQDIREARLNGQTMGDEIKVKHDLGDYETSLDTIFLRTMYAEMRSQVSMEYLPLFTALRAFLAFNGNVQGANMDSIIKTVDKFIQSNIFHKRIIDPSENTIYSILTTLRTITSVLGLAGSPISFSRETFSSYVRTVIDQMTEGPLMKDEFDINDYSGYVAKIIEESPKNVNQHSFYCQMNYRFAMAGMTSSQLASQMKTNWTNMNNWSTDILFLNTTAPDFVHRNAILMAVLKKRGSDKAYLQKEDGELYYDPTKDEQYATFFKYKDKKESEIPSSERNKYKTQEALYNKARLDWNQQYGLNIKFGEYLPDALSPTEADAVRTYADHLFGNFDDNRKALIQKSLLGSFVLQFKTFGLQQLMQAVRAKGYTNVIRSFFRTNEKGERIMQVDCLTPEEKFEHGDHRYMTETEAKDIPLEHKRYVIDSAGGATSGALTGSLEVIHDVFFDPKAFREKFNSSDVYKNNLKRALIDNLGMMIIAALIRLWFGEEKIDSITEQSWWVRWSYAVLMGVAQDGPINQVVGSLLGNGMVPSIAILQNFFNNSWEVITGEKPVLYGVLNTFGATRMFTGMVSG